MAKDDLSIDDYLEKRDFSQTPEPTPAAPATRPGSSVFVIHRHEARRLHYDLRLEMEGVLKSWAVPKGFSLVPEDKHLAVRTEDHPIEYEDFDGIIPKGQYGAGTMTIWDKGRYELAKNDDDRMAALREGDLKIRFFGKRLRGEWHVVKTNRDVKDWLLFKHRDRYARGANDPIFPLELTDKLRTAIPKSLKAMRPAEEAEPFSDPRWCFELEFAGERRLVRKRGDQVDFFDAAGKAAESNLGAVVHELRKLRSENAVVDGVLVALDPSGRPNPERLRRAIESGTNDGLVFYAFDLLYFDEFNLRGFSLVERKRALKSLLPSDFARVLYVDHVAERGEELVEVVRQGALSGVIAKRSDSSYRGGAQKGWRRIAAPDAAEAAADDDLIARLARDTQDRKVRSRAKLTNLQKVYWPGEGYTKGQLLDYYDRVAEVLLPYLRDRPLHLRRFPDGIEGQHFYHKNITRTLPDWVETVKVKENEDEGEIHYVVCNDRDTLLYLVNLGSIDLHPWMSQRDSLLAPDYGIIDLDPAGKEFGSKVVVLARTIGKILHGAGVQPLLKTSGASGMHIAVSFAPQYTYEQVRMFCEIVARWVVREHSDIATVERSVAQRQGKVYIDYMQNSRGQTVVPPYVVRPVPGASVSTPLEWDELQGDVHPSRYTLLNVPQRLEEKGDLFRALLTEPHDLAPALEALAANFE
ncbi:MAG: non-homologous end-joining DNA ligase [Planctomycetota bacterium]